VQENSGNAAVEADGEGNAQAFGGDGDAESGDATGGRGGDTGLIQDEDAELTQGSNDATGGEAAARAEKPSPATSRWTTATCSSMARR
jgi:hypothetical protein